MSPKPDPDVPELKSAEPAAATGLDAKILRLIRRAPERRALEAGEVDAVIDPATGTPILLPHAQTALLDGKIRFRSLVNLVADGHWEQDARHRFISNSGVMAGRDENILGKTFWDLALENGGDIDWATLRTQMEWRAVFRDLELNFRDANGQLRTVIVSGEPTYDRQHEFTGYHGITRDVTGRRPATVPATEADRLGRATLDALAAAVCVLDAVGTIVTANAAWRELARSQPALGTGLAEGDDYLAMCDRITGDQQVDAAAMAAGIRQVIAGERALFRYEYPVAGSPGRRSFTATVTPLSGDPVARATITYLEITELKHAERLLKLEYMVARCLADATETAAALQAVSRAICESQSWECGRYFRLDPAADTLHLEVSWSASPGATAPLTAGPPGATLRLGAGLAGRACLTGQPLWTSSVVGDARTAQISLPHELGADGAFMLPVAADGKTIGVLAFSGPVVDEPDGPLLRAVRAIGQQLGGFLKRRQAEDALRSTATRIRRLLELSTDWCWEQDREFRFTRISGLRVAAIEDILGRTLWELPAFRASEDDWFKLQTELGAQWSFCDFECAAALPDGELVYYSISGEPVYDEAGAFGGFHGTAVDISARRRAELAAR